MHPLYLSAIVNSALYLIGVFVAGLVTGNSAAWHLALLTAGLCYLAAVWQMLPPMINRSFQDFIGQTIVGLTIALGAAAGFMLMIQ